MSKTKNKWTVCLYPGAGAWVTPYEVTAENEEEALEKAVLACLGEDDENAYLMLDGGMEYYETFAFFDEEFKQWKKERSDDEYEFLTEYLNMGYFDLSAHGKKNVWLKHMEHVRIEKGIGLYENSIKENKKRKEKNEC